MDNFIRKVEDFEGTFEEFVADTVKSFLEINQYYMTSDFILYGILKDVIHRSCCFLYVSSRKICLLILLDDSLQGWFQPFCNYPRYYLVEGI